MAEPIEQDMTRAYFAYVSDDANTYQLASTKQNGLAQDSTPVNVGVNPGYPRGWVPRRVYGEDTDGNRTHVPIMSPSNALWLGTTPTFQKNNTEYTVYGKRGEFRFNRGG